MSKNIECSMQLGKDICSKAYKAYDYDKECIRAIIAPDERLAVALRFLASGESQASSRYCFKIGKATLCGIVEEVCKAIWTALQDYVRSPQTPQKWLIISRYFESIWNMPIAEEQLMGSI